MAQLDERRSIDGWIDLDRVIVDPDYRRRVVARLRAEAAHRQLSEPRNEIGPAASHDD